MSGLLQSPYNYDSSFIEGTVTNVDPIRFSCSVKTVKGSYLDEVTWLLPTGGSGKSGVHFTPNIGDYVLINTGLTYPVILGALPRLGLGTTNQNNMSGSELGVDTGNATNMKGGYTANPDKPSDFTPGDYVITSEGGGIFSMMANGSTLIKASALAQIFMSKFDDVVRVVARNWERFSDVSQQTSANVKGRLYEFMGWDRSLERSKTGLYELSDVIGDVAAGEVLKGEPNPATAVPAKDTRVRKYQLISQAGSPLMTETLTEDGTITCVIGVAKTTHTPTSWEGLVNGIARIIITPTNIVINYGSSSTITVDASKISAVHGDANMVLNATTANLVFGSASVLLNSSSANLRYGSNLLTVTSGGIQAAMTGASMTLNSSSSSISFGSHAATITSSGVNLT